MSAPRLHSFDSRTLSSAAAALVYAVLASLCPPIHSLCKVDAPGVGKVFGLSQLTALNHDPMCSYLGIRYARAERFGEPVLEGPSLLPTLAFADGSMCPQILKGIPLSLNEDCLFLNVYTPNKILEVPDPNKQPLKSVICYIHGGANLYLGGISPVLRPDFLVENDVIVVVINYRLGPFGYLALNTTECPGNMGLRDQMMSLKWIKKNIKAFGGDSNSVTIMGESAGSWGASTLALSPRTRGLFSKVIAQSPITSSFVQNFTIPYSFQFAEYLKKKSIIQPKSNDAKDVCAYLKQLSMPELVLGFYNFADELFQNIPEYNLFYTPFWPVIDGDMGEKSMLPKPLAELGKDLPPELRIISGRVSREGAVYFFLPGNAQNYTGLGGPVLEGLGNLLNNVIDLPTFLLQVGVSVENEYYVNRLRDNLKSYLKAVVFKDGTEVPEEIVAKVKDFYFNQLGENEVAAASDLYEDLAFYRYYDILAEYDTPFKNGSIYSYQFDYEGTLQPFKLLEYGAKDAPTISGATHGEDVTYTFYSVAVYPVFLPSEDDKKAIRLYSILFTNFAKTGNPNGDNTGLQQEWKPLTPGNLNHLQINSRGTFINEPINAKRYNFWKSITQGK